MLVGLMGVGSAEPCTAEIPPVQQNHTIDLTQVCDNCTYVNLTKVVYPNQSIALLGQYAMTQNGTNYNISYSDTNTLGTYYYTTTGDLNGDTTSNSVCFKVTSTGNSLSTSDSLIYIVLLVILLILDIILFYVIAVMKVENPSKDGEPIGVSIKKYFRILLIGISYAMILLTLNLMNALAISTSQVSQFSGIIGGLFSIMMSGAIVWTILIFIWIAVTLWKDGMLIKEIRKRLEDADWESE